MTTAAMRAAIIMLLGGLLFFTACSTQKETPLPDPDELGLVPLGPLNGERGARLYKENCAPCHGEGGAGDGFRAAELVGPKPRNYLDPAVRDELTARRVFIAMRDGMPGSAMQPFTLLAPQDRWHLAFHVMSLGHEGAELEAGKAELQRLELLGTHPRALTALSNRDLRDELIERGSTPEASRAAIGYLRSQLPFDGGRTASALARRRLGEAISAYRAGDHSKAQDLAARAQLDDSSAHLDILRLRNGDLAMAIDRALYRLRRAMADGAVIDEMEGLAQQVMAGYDLADPKLDAAPSAGIGAAQSASIALGYGADGALFVFVLMMIAGRRSRDRRERKMVALGSLLGLALAVLLWLAWSGLGGHSSLSGSTRAAISLLLSAFVALACLPLLIEIIRYFRWPAQLRPTLGMSGRLALFLLSTLIVVRDALEIVPTIVLISERTPASLLGFVGAGIVIVLLLSLFIILEKKMAWDERSGFLAIACTMAAIMAAGSAGQAAQKLGLLPVGPLGSLQSPWLGFWPTAEGVGMQMTIAAFCGIAILIGISLKEPSGSGRANS